ncbi:MAG: HAD-IIIA family hydrolase [Hydrogenothermaceae bacterium]|nr:HAD-IIIA family hydrolase [Hydrogenothermaceae bacterium]
MEERLKKIKWAFFDVDGVMTDGRIILDGEGKEIKNFNVKDGIGIHMLHMAGIRTGIITGRASRAVEKRAQELRIDILIQNSSDKLVDYLRIKREIGFSDEEVIFVGDDIVDLPILSRVGFAVTVFDAPFEVKSVCHYITSVKGGDGAVREVADLVLKVQGKYENIIRSYLR